jgi:hypothetical protein
VAGVPSARRYGAVHHECASGVIRQPLLRTGGCNACAGPGTTVSGRGCMIMDAISASRLSSVRTSAASIERARACRHGKLAALAVRAWMSRGMPTRLRRHLARGRESAETGPEKCEGKGEGKGEGKIKGAARDCSRSECPCDFAAARAASHSCHIEHRAPSALLVRDSRPLKTACAAWRLP